MVRFVFFWSAQRSMNWRKEISYSKFLRVRRKRDVFRLRNSREKKFTPRQFIVIFFKKRKHLHLSPPYNEIRMKRTNFDSRGFELWNELESSFHRAISFCKMITKVSIFNVRLLYLAISIHISYTIYIFLFRPSLIPLKSKNQ